MTAGPGPDLSKLTPKQRALLEQRMLEKRAAAGDADVIPRRRGDGAAPLSFAQERLWVVEQLAPGSPAYHIADAFLLDGALDVSALRRALEEMTARHESLRTTIAVVDGEPVQVVAASGEVDLQEATFEPPEDAFEDELQRLLAAESERPFDLERGPLLRVRVFHAGGNRHVLLLTMHHIVSDAWSRDVLFRELSALYDAFTNGRGSPLAELPIQYADYAAWQRTRLTGAVFEEQMAYWRDQLAGIPTLELPAARRRAAAARHGRGASAHATLPKPLTRAIKDLCRAENVTVSMLTLAALDVLLQRYCGSDDVVVGTPVAGRDREELNDLVGFFVNMLVMRTRLDGDPTVRELLARVRGVMLDAYERQEIPFEKLVEALDPERDLTRNPLFQVAFQYGRAAGGAPLAATGLTLEPLGVDLRTTRFDLEIHVWERDDDILVAIFYDEDLFDASTMQRMLAHYRALLEGLVADPDRRISRLPLLAEEERQRILVDWNQTSTDYPRDATVSALFARQAARTPDAVALEFAAERVTYDQLNRRANQVAHHLARRGAAPGTLVAVCVDRSVDFIVGLLGILKCGAAYVPLDPQYPAPRLAAMLEETRARVLLAHEAVLGDLPEHAAETICLDRDWPAIAAEPDANPAWDGGAEDLAYVMYTSGSTGRPKGVCVPHRAIARLVLDTNYVDLQPSDRIAQASNVSFDAATFEIWGALLNGAAVVGIKKDAMLSPARFGRELRKRRISVLFITTALFNQLVEASPEVFASLRYLLFGGEAVDPSRVRTVLAHGAPEHLLHVYGPTESTTYATWHEVTAVAEGATTVPIGRPLANTTMYVLDRAMQPVPVGVPGELYLGGDGLAHGYLASPELSADRFPPDPFDGRDGARLYRTGDLVRYRADGSIDFVGRTDAQVKVRGFRIEPGEIEAALCRHDAVREAVVQCREDEPGEKRLVAYVVSGDEDVPVAALRGHLRETLPDYMIPAAFVALESLPLTPNGKVDHKALPAPEGDRQVEEAYVAPRSEVEAQIAAIWREVLGIEQVGVHDNFFDLGGHSLRLVQVHGRLREELGCDLSMTDLFQHPTIAAVADRLRGSAAPATSIMRSARARAERRGGTAESAIAVIGMAGRFPGAGDVETLWSNLEAGIESVRFFTDDELRAAGVDEATLRAPNFVNARGALDDVELFDARHFGYTPREAELIDPQQRIFLECAWHALERAGYDPERFDGLIGVYAGASSNGYLANVQSHPELFAAAGLSAVLSSDKDFLPTRVSYKLNLRGPSMNIQTACSTSLVAVHEACRALLDQQCDIALAGGVAVSVHTVGGYFYQEGDIGSPDGHCRTFDARAKGTVRGDGAGIVVLKRLDEALRDGDEVHAVILGTAVNNDGSNKVGYTAPGVDGQAEVVAMAQAAAAVDPDTITYLEAHGTATPLGDPIEVAALTKVFREHTDRTGYCGLSALKSNVGHLDAAAGVAGLIKTVLALEHRTLPPSLHYEHPNPEIDFENSPFYVITECRDWEVEAGTPRRAGVSSFGLGGTNAHAVLEEAPALVPSDPSRGWQLLVLSAKSDDALEAMAADLAAHLGANESVNLADVAYTLQSGRRELDFRRAVRCRDVAEAIAALAGDRRELIDDGHVVTKARPVTFMFSGQGAQDVNMGVELYREPGVYRDAVEACLAIIDDELDVGLREVLYPDGSPTDVETEALRERLERTSMAQPALFTVSYALARQWMAWGIEPESMIGHSIGEYVAACMAGVLSLEDALRLVVARGRLMEAMPAGVMTAVPLPAEQVETLLNGADGDGLWLSVVNAPSMCVVSGTPERITTLETRLSAAGTDCRRLHTSHAFHSGLMEGAIAPFVELVRGVTINAPRIPYASNVTGDWITADDVRDPNYWGRQIREAVRFAEGMERILEEPNRVLLEVGPGTALRGLSRLQASFGRDQVAVASLGKAGSGEPAVAAMTGALGRLWAGGVAVDWSRVHGDARRRRVTLPTYPFQRDRYWVERRRGSAAAAPAVRGAARRADLAEWFYAPVWRRSRASGRPAAASPILVFARDAEFDRQVVARLRSSGRPVVVVEPGSRFESTDGGYLIDPTAPAEYARLLDELRRADSGLPGEVVHLWTLSFETHRLSADEADAIDDRGLRALLHFVRAFEAIDTDASGVPLRIDVVTDGAQDVTGRELIQPEKATALSFCRIVPLELANVSCRGIDLATSDGPAPGADLAEQVAQECLGAADDAMIAYRDGRRWTQSFVRVELDAPDEAPPRRLREHGVYLVTGGLGGMGLELAGELARAVRARLILTGRTALPARDGWSAYVAAHQDDATSRRIRAIEAMEAAGAEVMVAEADAADLDRMRAVVDAARDRFGRIDGVLHMAGVPGGGATGRAGVDDLERTFAPKIGGVRVLEEIFRETPPDFLVLASSLMTTWGVPGWVDYCAANTYLDAFARRFAADTGAHTVAIGWTRWREAGMAVDLARATGQTMTAQGVSSEEGIEAFRRIIDRFDEAQVLVSELDFRDAMSPRRMKALADALAGEIPVPEVAPEHLHARPKLSTDYDAPRNDTEQKLATIWQGLFGIERIGVHDNFFELGGDSVLGIQIVARAKGAGFAISPNSLFEHQTIAELAAAAGEADGTPGAAIVAEQGPVVGDVLLTPIQHWFFEHDFADAHHFNHSNMLAVRTRLSAAQWQEVVQALLAHHDVLRLRFAQDGGAWQQRCAAPGDPVPLEMVDLSDRAEAEQRTAIETRAAELQHSLDLADGPVARFALFDVGSARPQRLLIIIHHLAVDAVSWPILFEDVARLVEQIERGEPAALPDKTTSFQTWSSRLADHAQSAALTAELPYWSNLPWDDVVALPVDHPAGDDTMGTCASVGVSLDEDETRRLLRQLPRAGAVQVPEILLTAVTQAVAAWTGNRTVLVDVEGHGRETLFDDVDITRTVGWFTSMYPVLLSAEPGAGPAGALRSVKERLRAVPGHGIGYGLLRYMHENDWVRQQLATLPAAQVAFLYLGQADAGGGDAQDGIFARAEESTGPEQSPLAKRSHLLEIMGGVVGGRLHMKWTYSTSIHERATIEQLAGRFANALRELIARPASASDDSHPLSFAQQRLWFLDQLGMGAAYNMPLVTRLTGPLDPGALERGLATVVRRHEVLRTTFTAVDGNPVQVIAPTLDLPFDVVDLCDRPEAEREDEARRRAVDEAARPFDLAHGPLLRPVLYRLRDDEHILVLTMHHIVTDGWSLAVLARELTELYRAIRAGEPANLPDLTMQYADFARWQTDGLQGAMLDAHLDYWREHLGGDLPILQLPLDHARPALQTFDGEKHTVLLPAPISKALKERSREHSVTLAITLMAAFKTLLLRHTGQQDVVVGSPIANRTREELEHLIGFFVNTLAMRTDLSGDPTFTELVAREKKVALGAYEHQDLPFERLVEELAPDRSLNRNPIFAVMFAMQNAPQEGLLLGDVALSPVDLGAVTTRFDLEVYLREIPEGLHTLLVYNRHLFDASTMERMGRHFANLLTAIAEDPSVRLSALPMLDDAERAELVTGWNDTAVEYPSASCVHELFEEQAAATPDAIALSCEGKTVTYDELNRRANQVAHALRRRGVGPEVMVGLCVERSVEMVVGVLGILKAGGAYVPLDPSYPASRLAMMLEDTHARVLLTQASLVNGLPSYEGELIRLDTDWNDIAAEPETNPPNQTTADNLAYVMYTSGSTGRPKGVCVTHRSIVRLVRNTNYIDVGPDEVYLSFAPISFDASTLELWGSLLNGAKLVVFPAHTPSLGELGRLIRKEGVTTLWLTGALFAQMVDSELEQLRGVRQLLAGGDALSVPHVKRVIETLDGDRRLINGYGPTENTTFTCCHVMDAGSVIDRTVPIGRPIANTQVYLLDAAMNPVPIGIAGELYTGGHGLARGYLNDAALTAAKFVPNPFGEPGSRLYRTGDQARYRADGTIEFLGRIDHQVKVRGFRIELGEIESVLNDIDLVRSSVVTVREEDGDKRIVAYAVPELELDAVETSAETENRVQQWQDVYEDVIYRDIDEEPTAQDDAAFNIVGWNSTYTEQPLGVDVMREQVDQTLARIRSARPDRVLEIGCGTGMLLLPIAPESRAYVATDFSRSALDYVERHLDALGPRRAAVELRQRGADDFTGIDEAAFDLVVINSVIQYFPSIDYLDDVLRGAIRAAAPGGRVLVGDVRNLPLLEAFHSSVQRFQADADDTVGQLRQRIQQQLIHEQELVIDPEHFVCLAAQEPRVTHVQIMVKRGHAITELTKYRYDVILHVEQAAPAVEPDEWIDWEHANLSLDTLRRNLAAHPDRPVGVCRVPNARLRHDLATVEAIATAGPGDRVGHLARDAHRAVPDVDPEALWALSDELGCDVTIGWSDSGPGGRFDAIFVPRGVAGVPVTPMGTTVPRPRERRTYATTPLRAKMMKRLVPELRERVSERLPEYMMPSAFVVLDELPLTRNGKVDRAALPAPDVLRQDLSSAYEAPRTTVEETLAEIWTEVLGVERVGIHDDFFELGGHSLLATQVVSRIRERLDAELPLQAFFESPTVASLARCVQGLDEDASPDAIGAPPIVPVPRDGNLPLSFAQRRMWFLDQLGSGSAYHIPLAVRLTGPLDVDALERTIVAIVDRHETLRTSFPLVDGLPTQVIADSIEKPLTLVDLRDRDESEREPAMRQLAVEQAEELFDLARGPLFRAALVRMDDEDHVLLLTMHHIVTDGWSLGVFSRELAAFYRAFEAGETPNLDPLPIQYADFAHWQTQWLEGEVLERQLGYWREQLGESLSVLALPTDRPRPPVQTYDGAGLSFTLPADLTDALGKLGRAHGATLAMTMLAAFKALIRRYTGQTDIVVGTPIANRNRSEIENLIGFFVNTLAMRTDLSGDPTFAEMIDRVKSVALGAYEHQDLPFERIVEEFSPDRDLSQNPIFQVLFAMQNAPGGALELPSLTITGVDSETTGTRFDLELHVAESPTGMSGRFAYKTDLFDTTTIERMARHYRRLLQEAAGNPNRRMDALSILDAGEREQLLFEWNDTGADLRTDVCLHELFEEQVARTPDCVAIVDGDREVSYAELNARADALAHRLRELDVGAETPVGIHLQRGVEMVTAILATLKAGGTYLPLDPAYPGERIRFMLEDTGAAVVISARSLSPDLDGLVEAGNGAAGPAIVEIDEVPASSAEDAAIARSGVRPGHVAYVIYTSGSTGRPKGVAITHANAAALVAWARTVYGDEELAGVLAATSMCFDLSVFEMFVPLSFGGTIILAENAMALPTLPASDRVTLINTVPSAMVELVRQNAIPRSVRTVNLAGEPLSPALVDAIYDAGVERVFDLYGPSEDTTYTTGIVRERGGPATIGRPLANERVYLLDGRGEPVPVGITGELYVGGCGVARGYLNAPSLTATKFVPDPFSGEPGARLYRTGDLARYRADGNIEFLGRADHQVKLRGYRIELGEIESVFERHEAVREAVVIGRDDDAHGMRLVAYVVGQSAEPVEAELREHLRAALPEYMVPARFVYLSSIPLTPNGKVDRKALPAPDATRRLDPTFIAPQTETEMTIASIWEELLGLERVSAVDSFFDLGGHSLLATQVVSRIRERLDAELLLQAFFESPTVASLARCVHGPGAEGTIAPPITPVPRDGYLPLSFAQRRMWFLDQLGTEAAYHIPLPVRLSGPLDVGALERTLAAIVDRHETLRTTFATVDGLPVQVIADTLELPLPVVDLSELDEAERELAMRRRAVEEAERPFDLVSGPLLRTVLIRMGDVEHVLLLTMHHIVTDGWSLGVLTRELATFYRAFEAGRRPKLEPLPIQYADFAHWQTHWLTGEVLEKQLGYWREQLGTNLSVLALPTDRPRPAVQTFNGAGYGFRLSADLSSALVKLSRAHGATLAMTMMAAFKALLHRHTGQTDIVVGAPIANRNRSEIEDLIGFFVNTLAMRTDLSGDPTFAELIDRVKQVALGAYDHQDLPFERLVDELAPDRDLSQTPIFQVVFAMQNAPSESLQLTNLTIRGVESEVTSTRVDLALHMVEAPGGMTGRFSYNTDLFEASTIERMADRFIGLIAGAVADPKQRISSLPMLSDEERLALLVEANDTAAAAVDRCVHELFQDQVARTPQAVAITFGETSLTYAELNARANQLAHFLRDRLPGPGATVGLCVERSLEMLVGIVGILKAGCTYLPLDPDLPPARLAHMLGETDAGVVLTQDHLVEALPPLEVTVVRLDGSWSEIASARADDPDAALAPDALAYVIYTSGSTGAPKGVLVSHRSLSNQITWIQRTFAFDEHDRLLQQTPFGFDASLWDFFAPLLAGGRIVMADPRGHLDPMHLTDLIQRYGVTILHGVPALMSMLLEHPPFRACTSLRHVFCGGSALPASLADELSEQLGAPVHNLYGPTETTIDATFHTARRGEGPTVPLGRPIANTRAYVLDRHMNPVPIGVPGELYIGGTGVARGYVKRPDLTAERFVPDPISGETGASLYRTGDLVRWRHDGLLEFRGRLDHQVKLRGFRIELGEIESTLERHATVEEAVVVIDEDEAAGRRLVAYVVEGGETASADTLREHLRSALPEYMLPARFVFLDVMPLTPNGKVDRNALPAPETDHALDSTFVEPATETERALAEIWEELLGVERVGALDSFFDLGGHSLLMVQIGARIRARAGIQLSMLELFQQRTLRQLAGLYDLRRAETGGAAAPTLRHRLVRAVQRLWSAKG